SGDLQLVGDQASPGNSKLYGTDESGNKGWYDQPSGGGGGEGPFAIAADFFRPTATNGALDLQQLETNAAHPNQVYLGFLPSVDRFAECLIPRMPDDWNLGPVRFRFVWSHPATTTNFDVVWSVQARVTRNDDLIAADYGTAVNV